MDKWRSSEVLIDADLSGIDVVSYQAQIKVGDRVRVRLSGECQTRGKVRDPYTGKYEVRTHPDFADGLIGTVIVCTHCLDARCSLYEGHPFLIRMDHDFGTGKTYGAYFAASELEPLNP